MATTSRRGLRAAAVIVGLAVVVALFGVAQLGPSQEVVAALNADWSRRDRDTELRLAVYEPECKGSRDVGLGPVELSINKGGFRGAPRRAGATRVLLLGGSTLSGPGVGNKWEPGGLLEADLQALGHDVDVLNLSVEGYTTTRHAIRFKDHLNRHKPSLAVFDTLSAHKMFLDRMLQHSLVLDAVGHPKRLAPLHPLPRRGPAQELRSVNPRHWIIRHLTPGIWRWCPRCRTRQWSSPSWPLHLSSRRSSTRSPEARPTMPRRQPYLAGA